MICHDYINNYIRQTIKGNEGLLAGLEEFAGENHVPIIQPEVVRLLSVLGNMLKPSRILEIGTAIGYSAITMSSFLQQDGRIDTIERDEDMVRKAHANIQKAGLSDTISIIAGDALDVLSCLDKTYDMILLDAAKGQYGEFLPHCIRMLRHGGLLFSDNVLYKGMVANDDLVVKKKRTIVNNMRDFLDSICQSSELDTSIIPIGDGVALSYRK